MSSHTDTKIGDSVWLFDVNRRVYVDEGGNRLSSPIWLHHWRECKIVGETSRSWILDYFNKKVPKKGYNAKTICFSEEELIREAWAHNNRYHITEAIRGLNAEKLKEVASVIGYMPEYN